MRKAAVWFLLLVGAAGLRAEGEDFGEAVRRSLERSRAIYPESAQPDSALSRAILARIAWLNAHNRAFFTDPNWPLQIAAAEASALGIRPRTATATATAPRPAARPPGERRYLGMVTQSFSTTGASFRKGQQIVLESLQDYGKRGTTLVDGMPVLLWLDHVKILRELSPVEAPPVVVKVESARYGFPDRTGYSVSGMIQSLISPNAGGRYEILVSDALLTPAAARKMNRSGAATYSTVDPATGQAVAAVPPAKVLTVVYTIDGVRKTKQEVQGRTLVLD